MSRPSRRVVCDEDTRLELQAMAKSRKQPSGLGLRARIILQCLGNPAMLGESLCEGNCPNLRSKRAYGDSLEEPIH